MSKVKKTILIAVLILALVAGLGTGGYFIWRSNNTGTIDVFPVANVSTDYWGDDASMSGQITAGSDQTVVLREGLIQEMNLTEGQSVKKGDVLMVYDTTSFQLTLQSDEARIAVAQSNIDKKKEEIAKYYSLKPSEWAPQPTEEIVDHGALSFTGVIDVGTPSLSGSYGMLFRCQEGARVTSAFLKWLRESGQMIEIELYEEDTMYGTYVIDGSALPQPKQEVIDDGKPEEPEPEESKPEGPKPEDSHPESSSESSPESSESSAEPSSEESSAESSSEPESSESSEESSGEDTSGTASGSSSEAPLRYGKMQTVTVDPLDEDWVITDGVTFTGDGVSVDFSAMKNAYGQLITCTPTTYERYETIYHDNTPSNAGENYMYSKKELAEMATAAEKELISMQLDLRGLQLTYEKDQLIGQTGEVYADIDGTIADLKNPDALSSGETLFVVKGSENYTVTAYVSEMRLASVQPGDSFSVFAYESGSSFEAIVEEIETTPVTGSYGWSENPNNSYYPVVATVADPDVTLTIGEYCDITMQTQAEETASGIFVPRYLIRKDDQGSYMMKADENGHLVKQYVKTGRTLWGEMTEVLAGIRQDDLVAFPYGKTVREGADTNRVDYPSYQ